MDRASDKEKRMARDVQGSPVENREQVSVTNTAEPVLTTSNKQPSICQSKGGRSGKINGSGCSVRMKKLPAARAEILTDL